MTERIRDAVERVFVIRDILDRVTDKVLGYRPVDKGLAAKKTKRRLSRVRKTPQTSDEK